MTIGWQFHDIKYASDDSFLISGMQIKGACWETMTKKVELTDDISKTLPMIAL